MVLEMLSIMLVLTVLSFLPSFFVFTRQRLDRPVMLGAYLANQGVAVADLMGQGREEAMAKRARRCITCKNFTDCCARLDSQKPANLSDICLNQDFIDEMKAA